jgi:hypothetical protein
MPAHGEASEEGRKLEYLPWGQLAMRKNVTETLPCCNRNLFLFVFCNSR